MDPVTKAKESESYFAAEEIIAKSVKNPTKSVEDVEKKGKAFYDEITKKTHIIFGELVQCIKNELEPSSDDVQRIIKKHHAFAEQFHTSTKEVYKALAQLYREHPEFRKQLDPFHPQLADFMAKAMNAFADHKLSK